MSKEQKVACGERRKMIAEAAYFCAERRGFTGGDAVRDWCEAEVEIDARLREIESRQLRDTIEERLAAAGKTLAAVRRKIALLSAEAREEWQEDVDRLVELRDTLRPKLAELKEQGAEARQKVREQADKLAVELAALANRLARKRKHRATAPKKDRE